MKKLLQILSVLLTIGLMTSYSTTASAIIISSTDVPHTFIDNNSTGFTTTLTGPNLVITDLNLIFDELLHTSVPDIHGELTSPFGTNVTFLKAFTENGILVGLGTPENFIGTILDDEAPTNLAAGVAPYTGSFNVNHALSGINNPFSVFIGENAIGSWTLFLSDLASADVGTLNEWSIEFSGTPAAIPEPSTLLLLGTGLLGVVGIARRRKG
jgi:hypothetical protein